LIWNLMRSERVSEHAPHAFRRRSWLKARGAFPTSQQRMRVAGAASAASLVAVAALPRSSWLRQLVEELVGLQVRAPLPIRVEPAHELFGPEAECPALEEARREGFAVGLLAGLFAGPLLDCLRLVRLAWQRVVARAERALRAVPAASALSR